ncbi:Lrp/AsnC family transcriptional regulator [Sphingorhabdus contaminans]|uniref:Lrp/AsnC family transcriptional regulator n=1 Tax=Sphingorhabdus contaminans TaxID=1343899 RepID=UPI003D2CC562
MKELPLTLDIIDRQILRELQRDGSLSISALADKLDMTAPPCWRRVQRLRDEGILDRRIWLVDPEKLGRGTIIYVTVKLANHDRAATTAFRAAIQKLDEVLECYILLGGIDALIKIRVPNVKDYERIFYDRLSQLPAVREFESSVVLSEVKQTTEIPV